MNREVSWNLGLWRGEHGLTRAVRVAASIDLVAYAAGHAYGLELRRIAAIARGAA